MQNNKLLDNFREQVQLSVDRSTLIPSEWMCKNFKDPRNDRKPWSFKDHEFQIDIVDCGEDVTEVSCIKAAQTGLSTIQIRLNLAFAVQHDYLKLAYILPTSTFAKEFTQSRLDAAIDSSPMVRDLVSVDADNMSMKKIGTCFLLMRGTTGTTAAISQDLDLITIDEYDFCNQNVLSSFSSRLQHSELKLKRNFSTPTLEGFGIDNKYLDSSKAVRMVRHDSCSQWVYLSFFNDVVIPGFNLPMSEFRKEHLEITGVNVEEAFFKCPHCKGPITQENLADPNKRQWVDEHPSKAKIHKGFRVSFWDVPKYNPLPTVLSSIKDYVYQDYCNFRIGVAHSSSENSFLDEVIARNIVVKYVRFLLDCDISPSAKDYPGIFIGCDLGKGAHIMIGANRGDCLEVLFMAKIVVAELPDQSLGKLLVKLIRACRASRTVVDAGPDYTVSLQLGALSLGYGAYYEPRDKGTLDIYRFKEDRGIVKIDRDASLDDLAKAVNSGFIKWPDHPEMNIVRKHFKTVKKTKVMTSKGVAEKWSRGGEDHYAHAANYMLAAYASLHERLTPPNIVYMPPNIGGIMVRDV